LDQHGRFGGAIVLNTARPVSEIAAVAGFHASLSRRGVDLEPVRDVIVAATVNRALPAQSAV
jgi:hypothetical protein